MCHILVTTILIHSADSGFWSSEHVTSRDHEGNPASEKSFQPGETLLCGNKISFCDVRIKSLTIRSRCDLQFYWKREGEATSSVGNHFSFRIYFYPSIFQFTNIAIFFFSPHGLRHLLREDAVYVPFIPGGHSLSSCHLGPPECKISPSRPNKPWIEQTSERRSKKGEEDMRGRALLSKRTFIICFKNTVLYDQTFMIQTPFCCRSPSSLVISLPLWHVAVPHLSEKKPIKTIAAVIPFWAEGKSKTGSALNASRAEDKEQGRLSFVNTETHSSERLNRMEKA